MKRLHNTCPEFSFDAQLEVSSVSPEKLEFTWRRNGHSATLRADLATCKYCISVGNDVTLKSE